MFCPNCGREVKNSKFCSGCGTPIVKETDENQKVFQESELNQKEQKDLSKEGKKTSARGLKIAIFVVIAIGLCGGLFIAFRQDKSEKFIAMLKNGEYTEAAAYYQSDLAGDEKELKKVYETVTAEINSLVESYYADNMSYDDAKNGLNAYSNFYATETNNALQRIEALKASKDAFTLAEEKFEAEDYRAAHSLYLEVIEDDSNYSSANGKIAECYEIISDQIWANSENSAGEGDYLQAANILENEMTFFNEADRVSANTKIEEYRNQYLSENMAQFDNCLTNADYDGCFAMLDTMVSQVGTNEQISQATSNLHAAYENYITEQVNQYLESRDLVTCMQWIRQGQEKIPSSETFSNLETMLQEYYPVSLYEMEPFAIGDDSLGKHDTKEDTMGNVRNNVFRGYAASYEEQYNIYNIEGKYNTLKATVAVTKSSIGSEKIGYIKIYGDDLLLWEDTNINAMTEPYEINVNIFGVKHLKIEMCGPGSTGWGGIDVMLCDPILQK